MCHDLNTTISHFCLYSYTTRNNNAEAFPYNEVIYYDTSTQPGQWISWSYLEVHSTDSTYMRKGPFATDEVI
jgi:hypothetical protein